MNHAAAITAINRALAHYRRRQAHAPTDHSAREIAQMSMLAEYLHETHTPDAEQHRVEPHAAPVFNPATVSAAA
jgi:hypothetical protein